MKLWYSPASPFVRKVAVTACEAGLSDAIEQVDVNTNVVQSDSALAEVNPLAKIPSLELADGDVLFDSRVICAYLRSHPDSKLPEVQGDDRFKVMMLEALADGIMDAAVATRYETALRPDSLQWDLWIEGQMNKVARGLDVLEAEWIDHVTHHLDGGTIATACALGYLDFRFPDLGWRDARPGLAAWFADFDQRPSMQDTNPDA